MVELWIAQGADGKAAAHMLLEEICRGLLGWSALPEQRRGPSGKPEFCARGLWFNLSHSGTYGLCGLSDTGEIGVDVERIRPRRPALPEKLLARQEYLWYEERGRRWEDFYALWTLKEARAKQTGRGLDRPAREISVPPLEPGGTAVFSHLMFASYGGEGWRAAFCGPELPVQLKWFKFS